MFEEQRIVLESLLELINKHLGSTRGLGHTRFILVGRRIKDLRTTFADHEIANIDGLDLVQSPTFDAGHRTVTSADRNHSQPRHSTELSRSKFAIATFVVRASCCTTA